MKVEITLRDFLDSYIDNFTVISIWYNEKEVVNTENKRSILDFHKDLLDKKIKIIRVHWFTRKGEDGFLDCEEACLGVEVKD